LPRLRRYTIRRHDPVARTVDVDLVLHADGGPAAEFAATARPGDRVIWWGPTAAYEPGAADAHLLLADETGLPAVAAILEELPADAVVRAVVEVPDLADAQDDIEIRADADVRWLPRGGTPAGRSDALLEVVQELSRLPGRCRVWAAGERAQMRAVRRLLLAAGVPREDLHVAAYWELGAAQDAVSERRDRERAAEMRRRRAAGEQVDATLPDEDDDDEDDDEELEAPL
jgi:NADPH-dependent ferric siderophore reductase